MFAHDGRSHRVLHVIEATYRGEILEVRCGDDPPAAWLTLDQRVLAKLRPRTLGGHSDWSGSPVKHIAWRRQLRNGMTPPERMLWSVLRNEQLGWKFRRQSSIGPFIADFYCREARLVVEVDGMTHTEPEAIEYDRRRDCFMRALGLSVLRFSARDVSTNVLGVREAIYQHCVMQTRAVEGAEWVQAASLRAGDLVFAFDPGAGALHSTAVTRVTAHSSDEAVCALEIEGAHSFMTEVCAVQHHGSIRTSTPAKRQAAARHAQSRAYLDHPT